jgi:hypothetical protein
MHSYSCLVSAPRPATEARRARRYQGSVIGERCAVIGANRKPITDNDHRGYWMGTVSRTMPMRAFLSAFRMTSMTLAQSS